MARLKPGYDAYVLSAFDCREPAQTLDLFSAFEPSSGFVAPSSEQNAPGLDAPE